MPLLPCTFLSYNSSLWCEAVRWKAQRAQTLALLPQHRPQHTGTLPTCAPALYPPAARLRRNQASVGPPCISRRGCDLSSLWIVITHTHTHARPVAVAVLRGDRARARHLGRRCRRAVAACGTHTVPRRAWLEGRRCRCCWEEEAKETGARRHGIYYITHTHGVLLLPLAAAPPLGMPCTPHTKHTHAFADTSWLCPSARVAVRAVANPY